MPIDQMPVDIWLVYNIVFKYLNICFIVYHHHDLLQTKKLHC